jgi:hypothetical protein
VALDKMAEGGTHPRGWSTVGCDEGGSMVTLEVVEVLRRSSAVVRRGPTTLVKHGGAKGRVQSAGASSEARLTGVGWTGRLWIPMALVVLR